MNELNVCIKIQVTSTVFHCTLPYMSSRNYQGLWNSSEEHTSEIMQSMDAIFEQLSVFHYQENASDGS
jgi:hypothetical protein